ncbi:hypothetical protein BCR44DRAFT_1447041 [Catenaria anguillulae PL171]|uniref:Uncharacterized protein n=1 Tax=Catenaria anguillulae PL171 TaxID=765915 RepID=A0A1Y2H5Z9_9FUNG|nr:hypothetical protein BCR44DRAFT_1447041 [Catenaria anguillulae PL171]
MNDLISSTSASSLSTGNPINSVQAPHQSLSPLPVGLMSPPGFPTPFGHTMASGLVGGGMSQSMTGFPQSHVQMHAPPPQHHILLEHHGFSGSAAYDAFHNTGLASPLPSAPSAPSSHPGSAFSNPPVPPAQYAYQPLPPQIQQQQQQQQVVVLLPSTAKIDRLQFAQVVNAVSLALQRTVEFKDLLMTVAPTPLVVMEPDLSDTRTQSAPATKVETYEQGVMVGSRTQSVGVSTAIVECKVTETQTTSASCVSIETQTEDSEMLRAILDKAMDSPTSDRGDAGNDQDPVVWFNKADLVKQDNQASSSRHSSSYSWSGSITANLNGVGPAADETGGSPIRSTSWCTTYQSPVSNTCGELSDTAIHSLTFLEHLPPVPAPPSSFASQRVRPPLAAAKSTAPQKQDTAQLSPWSQSVSASSNPTLATSPNRPFALHPSLTNPPTLPLVPPAELNHPLTLVTPIRPANSGPAPYHVTLRNLRPSVTPSDLLYLARDLRSLVKVYYPPHAFFSFAGRAAVYFISDEVEAIGFARWMQGQIQRGTLRGVYELTEADVRDAEVWYGLDGNQVRRCDMALAVTTYSPGKKGLWLRRNVSGDIADGTGYGACSNAGYDENNYDNLNSETLDVFGHDPRNDYLADGLASTHIAQASNRSTTTVYRAAIVGQTWDCLEQHRSITDPNVKYQMRACAVNGTPSASALEQHIIMGWANATRSAYISFTTDPNWAAYYMLMSELVGGQVRKLYRLEVPTAQLISYGGSNGMCTAFTRAASEVFAHRYIDIYDYTECVIKDEVRQSSKAWCAQRKREAACMGIPAKYPFAEWLAETSCR